MVSTKFEIPIYRGTVTLYYGEDLIHIQNKYKTVDLSNYGAVTFRNPKSPFKDYIVAFECVDYSLVAHEVVHLINYLYLDCGIHLDRENDEHTSYITGFFYKKIELFLNKHNK